MPSMFYNAIVYGDLDMLKEEYLHIEDINQQLEHKDGLSYLGLAITLGRLDIVQFLIEKGANIFDKDEYGKNLLMIACINKQSQVLNVLLETDLKTKIEEKDDLGNDALYYACKEMSVECTEILLENGADPNVTYSNNIDTLSMVVENPELLKLLLRFGAKIKYDLDGINVFVRAIIYNEKSSFDLLLPHIEDINVANRLGKTALHYASSVSSEYVKEILDNGGDPKLQDFQGFTPVQEAIFYNKMDVLFTFEDYKEKLTEEDKEKLEQEKMRWLLRN